MKLIKIIHKPTAFSISLFFLFICSTLSEPDNHNLEKLLKIANRLEQKTGTSVPITSMVLLDSRDDISIDTFYTYWRDVHGILVAQSPLEEVNRHYWQYHLNPADPNLWPSKNGILVSISKEEQIEGIAMATLDYSNDTFKGVITKEKVIEISKQIMEDEKNVFKGTYAVLALGENTMTLVDKRKQETYHGNSENFSVVILLRKYDKTTEKKFRDYLRGQVAGSLVNEGSAVMIKLHFLEDHTTTTQSSPGVENLLPSDRRYNAILELTYPSRKHFFSALNTDSVGKALSRQKKYLKAVAAYPIGNAYTLAYKGKPTLMGLRGYSIVKTIDAVGAKNQKGLDILKNIYGADTLLPEL